MTELRNATASVGLPAWRVLPFAIWFCFAGVGAGAEPQAAGQAPRAGDAPARTGFLYGDVYLEPRCSRRPSSRRASRA